MDKKLRKRFDEILEIKPLVGYYLTKPHLGYMNISMTIDILLTYKRGKLAVIEMLLEKLKKMVTPYGHFTDNPSCVMSYSFKIHIVSEPVDVICKVYQSIKEFLTFSKGLLSSRIEDGMELHFYFLKKEVYNLEKSHLLLLSYIIDHRIYFKEGDFNTLKVMKYMDYLKYQLDVAGPFLAINYLGNDVIEIKNIRNDLTKRELSSLLYSILGVFYYERFTFSERRKYHMERTEEEEFTYQLLSKFIEEKLEKKDQNFIKSCLRNQKTFAISFQNGNFTLIDVTESILNEVEKTRELSYHK